MVKVHTPQIKGYKNGYYYEPFMAVGVRKDTMFCNLKMNAQWGGHHSLPNEYRFWNALNGFRLNFVLRYALKLLTQYITDQILRKNL
jgi:hypothetical protein